MKFEKIVRERFFNTEKASIEVCWLLELMFTLDAVLPKKNSFICKTV